MKHIILTSPTGHKVDVLGSQGGGVSRMDIKQSFVLAISRVKLSLYEQRILIKMIEIGQQRLKGLWLRENLKKLEHDLDNVRVVVPVKYLLTDGSQHYEQVYEAARSLVSRRFEFEDEERKTWFVTSLIYNVQLKKRSGMLSFYVSKVFYDVLFDFTRGYCEYDLATVLSLPSPYAVRFYVLFNGQHKPISYGVDFLKKMFGVADKYSQTADFIKKVVDTSQRALDDAKTNSFTYTRVKTGNKVTSLTFTPVQRVAVSEGKQLANSAVSMLLPKDIMTILTVEAGFTLKELQAHKPLWAQLSQHPAAIDILDRIVERFRKGRKQKGYIINALRSELGIPRTRKAQGSSTPPPSGK